MDGVTMNTISIIGAFFSIVGAIVAIRHAIKARKYKDEILHDRLKMLLIDVMGIAKKARDECRKIITPIGKAIRGVDQQQVIDSIRECLEKIKDNNHKFSVETLPKSILQIEKHIAQYAKESEDKKRYAIGDQIHENLREIISCLSKEIDRQV